MVGFFQKFVGSSLSILLLLVHFLYSDFFVIRSRLLLRSCFLRCLPKNLAGPLSGVSSLEGQSSFSKYYGVASACSCVCLAVLNVFPLPSFANLSTCSFPSILIGVTIVEGGVCYLGI